MAENRQDTLIAGSTDVEERLPKGPARLMITVDRLVECNVSFTRLVTGSLHPAAAAVLQVLGRVKRPWTLPELSIEIGARGEVGLRFTSELVARLCHAKRLAVCDGTPPSFVLQQNAQEFARPRTEVLTRTLFYVPRIAWLAPHIPATSREKLPKYEPPDENALYAPSALRTEIQRISKVYASNERNLLGGTIRESGDEHLERTRLLLRTPKIVDAVVTDVRTSKLAIAHRCFFSAADTRTPWVKVFRAREARVESEYTSYFIRMIEQNPEFLAWMQNNSRLL